MGYLLSILIQMSIKEIGLSALAQIFSERFLWRKQILHLALFSLRKEGRGAALSWGWFLVRPAAYLFCFWLAIGLGLRGASNSGLEGLPPYFLWLSCGIIPWMFMREILSKGASAIRNNTALASSVRFPLSCITSITVVSSMIVLLALVVILLGIYFSFGMGVDLYLLQLPVLLILMLFYWDLFALVLSILGAISKDISQLVGMLSMPLFWLSGVIFNINTFPLPWMRAFFIFNPITFFTEGFRAALYYKTWFFTNVEACAGFVVVCIITLVATALVYRRFARMVPDVL